MPTTPVKGAGRAQEPAQGSREQPGNPLLIPSPCGASHGHRSFLQLPFLKLSPAPSQTSAASPRPPKHTAQHSQSKMKLSLRAVTLWGSCQTNTEVIQHASVARRGCQPDGPGCRQELGKTEQRARTEIAQQRNCRRLDTRVPAGTTDGLDHRTQLNKSSLALLHGSGRARHSVALPRLCSQRQQRPQGRDGPHRGAAPCPSMAPPDGAEQPQRSPGNARPPGTANKK